MYKFTVKNEEERQSLQWLAERYESAELLYDCVGEYPGEVFVPEHIAWEVLDATERDGADRGIVPCLGGRLGDEIHKMLEGVV